MKKLFATAGAALALAAVPTSAQAAATIELALLIDGSGSMSAAEFNLQRQSYANVLSNIAVLPTDGSVAIGVWQFSSGVSQVFAMTEITGANIAALIAAINGMTQLGGSTNIAGAITTATTAIFGNGIDSTRQLIDVSTDGDNNVGNLNASRAAALAAGIDQINCIGIGGGANCAPVIGGAGAFAIQANSFQEFQTALERKIVTEVRGVPEPSTWALLILGFGAVGATMRRRRQQTASVSFA